MSIGNQKSNMEIINSVCDQLALQWPDNRTVNIVCHGHSVPSGYFATPFVNTFSAYPHLLHLLLKERFPYAVINVIVTAIGGEHCVNGAKRFDDEVMCHRPDVLTIDYGLNDRGLAPNDIKSSWSSMIERAQSKGSGVILLTPTWEQAYYRRKDGDIDWVKLEEVTQIIRDLAKEYDVGLADCFAAFEKHVESDSDLVPLLSHINHPTKAGHEIVANEISKFFIAR